LIGGKSGEVHLPEVGLPIIEQLPLTGQLGLRISGNGPMTRQQIRIRLKVLDPVTHRIRLCPLTDQANESRGREKRFGEYHGIVRAKAGFAI